jgi:hypothetical protein
MSASTEEVFDAGYEVGVALMKHPQITAGAFG